MSPEVKTKIYLAFVSRRRLSSSAALQPWRKMKDCMALVRRIHIVRCSRNRSALVAERRN